MTLETSAPLNEEDFCHWRTETKRISSFPHFQCGSAQSTELAAVQEHDNQFLSAWPRSLGWGILRRGSGMQGLRNGYICEYFDSDADCFMKIFSLNTTCRYLNNRYEILKTKVKSNQPKAALRKSNILLCFYLWLQHIKGWTWNIVGHCPTFCFFFMQLISPLFV